MAVGDATAPPARLDSGLDADERRRLQKTAEDYAKLDYLVKSEASRLEKIVNTLQKNIFCAPGTKMDETEVALALAELKQIRDRFLYRIVVE